jgi:hypothetical protein
MNLDYWLEQMKATTAIAAHLAVPIVAPATKVVTIARSGSGMQLTWPHVTQDVLGNPVAVTSYEVWRSTKPYFLPVVGDPDIGKLIDVLPPFGSTVSASVGTELNGSINYYLVRAVAGATVSNPSNRVGVFMFGVVPGDP